MKKTILVTGCAGYIGTVLCQHLLHAGYKVHGVDSLAYNQETSLFHLIGHKDFLFHWTDCRVMDNLQCLVRQADVVIPLAAVVGAPACDRSPDYATSLNYEAVKNLVGLCSPLQRIVYPNTNSGYGQTDGTSEVTEDDPLTPISLYGRTKCDAEKAVLDHPRGVALRLATVFGPSPRMRFDLMVNDFTMRLMKEETLTVFEPNFKRNFLHIRDAARAFHFMANDDRLSGVFNVGDPGANMTKLELAHTITSLIGLDCDVVKVGDGTDPDKRNYLVSNRKLLNAGFSFKHPLDDGILDVANVARLLSPPAISRMRNA